MPRIGFISGESTRSGRSASGRRSRGSFFRFFPSKRDSSFRFFETSWRIFCFSTLELSLKRERICSLACFRSARSFCQSALSLAPKFGVSCEISVLSAGVGMLDSGAARPSRANESVAATRTIDMKVKRFILFLLQKPCQHPFRLISGLFGPPFTHNIV